MEISSIKMISFRNHEKTNISFGPGITIIWGENGSGKTSILEAIHSLSFGSSFRTSNKKELIKTGADNFTLEGFFKIKKESKARFFFHTTQKEIKK
jgi:Recombinational DNA repair ATPase (RecF pathway)